jgi:hypothetical protein
MPAQALVRTVAICETSGGLRVGLYDNQGIGFDRTSHFGATVTQPDGTLLASYKVAPKRKGSISFGRMHYLDQESEGQKFDIAFPSTNFHNIILSVILPDGSVIQDDNLNCPSLSQN